MGMDAPGRFGLWIVDRPRDRRSACRDRSRPNPAGPVERGSARPSRGSKPDGVKGRRQRARVVTARKRLRGRLSIAEGEPEDVDAGSQQGPGDGYRVLLPAVPVDRQAPKVPIVHGDRDRSRDHSFLNCHDSSFLRCPGGRDRCPQPPLREDPHDVPLVLGAPAGGLHPIQEAFSEEHGLQCGFCTPGMMLTSVALLAENPDPTDGEIRWAISGNVCRCTGYQNIVKAVHRAAAKLKEGS